MLVLNDPAARGLITFTGSPIRPPDDAVCNSPCSLNNYSGSASVIGIHPLTGDTYTLILNQIPQLSGANEYGPVTGAIIFTITTTP
jgi:hypothetical protein